MTKLILSCIAFFLMSCSTNDTSDSLVEQNIYENNKFQDYELFDNANIYIDNNEYDLALIELDKIEVLFPNSIYANKGMLLTAYTYFKKKDYEKTRAISENFKKYYPGSEDIVYANYLDSMTYYTMLKKPGYDQKNAYKALEKFSFILNAYPNSKYEIDIITKISLLNNNLASDKLSTAKFYFKKNNLNAALIYLKDIYENYNSSHHIEETLYFLTKIYKLIDEIELAKNYAAILAYNFPNSVWYEKSYKLINDIDIQSDNENWFIKFNPVKLLISKKVDNNFKIKKID